MFVKLNFHYRFNLCNDILRCWGLIDWLIDIYGHVNSSRVILCQEVCKFGFTFFLFFLFLFFFFAHSPIEYEQLLNRCIWLIDGALTRIESAYSKPHPNSVLLRSTQPSDGTRQIQILIYQSHLKLKLFI